MSTEKKEIYRRALIPLPIRIRQSQRDALEEMREADGRTIQEHIRTALDEYIERSNKRK
jgi:CHASE3 domain sensor protein